MIDVFKAELSKLTRPRILIGTAVVVLFASILAPLVVYLSAKESAAEAAGRAATYAELARAGGATQAFSIGMSFTGFFVFVVFAANWAGEFSQGTFRTLLMKQPGRLPLLTGKLAGLLVFAASVLFVAEIGTTLVSLVLAPAKDISTDAWFSAAALRAGAGNYATALFGISAWACFGMTLAVLLRSTVLALAIGIAWAGPFEHLTQRALSGVSGWYPGLLLESLAVGGTTDVSLARALTILTAYIALAATVATLTFTRRDITA